MNKSQKEGRVLDKEIFLFCPKARSVKYFGVIFNLRVNEVFFFLISLSFFSFSNGVVKSPGKEGRGAKRRPAMYQFLRFLKSDIAGRS